MLSDDSVSDCPTLVFRASSRKSRGLGFASTSTHVRIPHKSSATGHSILYDNFLSHRRTGIRASVFQCAEDQFLELCRLHGLHVDDMQCRRDQKTKLIYHLLNGDCFGTRCLSSSPAPDRSACLNVAAGFSSSYSISSFLVSILKTSPSSIISTENLLLIVNSLGSQAPYVNRLNLRRHTMRSLDTFLQLCQLRDKCHANADPYGDLFMGFETKRRPTLLAIMDHHGLVLHDHQNLSTEDMRNAIISHISQGDCLRSIPSSRTANSLHHQKSSATSAETSSNSNCEDFVDYVPMSDSDSDVRLKILTIALLKINSRKTMQRFLKSQNVPHNATDSLKHLRLILKQYISVLETPHNSNHDDNIESDWPHTISHTLKDQIARNFIQETSTAQLQSFICASCSSSVSVTEQVVLSQSSLDLTCLQHPETRMSGKSPDLSHISATNIDASYAEVGILIDHRGIDNETISFCKDCYSHIRKSKTPPLSLANNLLLGDVPPELQGLTVVEESMIARCRAKICIIQLKAQENSVLPNAQRALHGHIIIYPQKPDNLLHVLPPTINEACTPICVVFVGSRPPSQQWLREKAKPLIVRQERVRTALLWLKEHNPLYRDVIVDEETLKDLPENDILPVHIQMVDDNTATDILTSRYDQLQSATLDNVQSDTSPNTIFDSITVTGIDGNVTVNQMRAAAMHHMKSKKAGFIQIPHDEKPVNEFYSPDLLPMTYPTLFPYGIGGFEDIQRPTPLSFKRQVKLFFSLADLRFQEHYSFLFTVFNILQRRAILLHTSLKVKKTSFDHFAKEFEGISSETIHRVCERLTQSKTGTSNFANCSPEEWRVVRLLKEVNVINTHVAGSTAARVAMRNEIRALIMEKGLPSFYITINPADVYNPLVKFLAGHDIDIDNLLPEEVPDYMEQSILIARNPFVGAKFFNIYIKAFIKTILGYDPSKTVSEEGVLGIVNAYYGCVEAQGRGSLHCHMVIWLSNAFNCDQIRDRVLKGDHDFQQRMIKFIDDCISNEIPSIPSQPTSVPSDNRHPSSVRCYPNLDDRNARQKDLHNVVKNCQTHKHSATCFKYWKGPPHPKICRFDLGEHRVQPKTEFNQLTGELQIRHLDGLVNNFNKTIIELIRCNMDIQFLGSGPSTKAIIYYITDYITKAQLKAHVAYAALELAVKKLEIPNTTDDIPTIRAKKLLQKCAYGMISEQELSSQQIASYLLDYEDHFTSHTFERLYWTMYERVVDQIYPLTTIDNLNTDESNVQDQEEDLNTLDSALNDEKESLDIATDLDNENIESNHIPAIDEVLIIADRAGLKIQTAHLHDYLQRGPNLISLSLWEYITLIQKIPHKNPNENDDTSHNKQNSFPIQTNDIQNDNHTRPKYMFDPAHPDYKTHIQELRHPTRRPLPTLIGPSLPRRDREESTEKYCRLMLLLLKPWCYPEHLMGNFTSFELAFQAFQKDNPQWTTLLDNMQLLHECRDSRDDHFENRSRLPIPQMSSSSTREEDDDFPTYDSTSINHELLDHLQSIDNSRSIHLNQSNESVAKCLQEANLTGMFSYPSDNDFNVDCVASPSTQSSCQYEQDWRHEYESRRHHWKNNIITEQQVLVPNDVNENPNSYQPSISVIGDAPFTIKHLFNSKDNISTRQHQSRANIESIQNTFTLNEEQNRAFEMITEHSLEDTPNQLRMFICGPGGTGKSRVIDALRHFFHIQDEDHRLRLTSYTGVAAKHIRGMTLHSALNLNQRKKRTDKARAELISMWQKVDYLIIDEISMIGCKLLLSIHEALCEAKENTRPFGGINLICAGDFAQLPPVGDTKLYSHINSAKAATASGQKDIFGKLLWLSIDTVIILHQLVRQNAIDDKYFTDLLGRLRTGSCTDADYFFLNSKLLRNTRTDFTSPTWNSAPVIVSNNDVKDAFNLEAAKTFATRTHQQLHFYYATDKRSGKPITDAALREKLLSYHTGKTEQRLGRLPLCQGMPVMLTQNYDVANGIVNGCIGTLEKVHYTLDNAGNRHAHSCIIHTESVNGSCLPHLKTFEIVALEDETSMTFSHPHSNKKCTFRRTQLPVMPAFALTVHKSQGSTLSNAILDLESCLSMEAAYVMLSRVTKSDNIRILRPFHKTKITIRPSEDLRKEFRRLEYLNTHHDQSPFSPNLDNNSDVTFGGCHELDRLERWFSNHISQANDVTMTGRRAAMPATSGFLCLFS